MDPERVMRRALTRARARQGRTHPNPAVGAVVFRGDRILGAGGTRPPGGAHAEIVALDRARRRHGEAALRGASLAVTLEPCHHQGRTGPCTAAIREAGIARVFVGTDDPHPAVSGRGLRWLRRVGIRVQRGVLEEECRWHHRGFLSVCERGRPWVALKLAATLDGRIATQSGESQWITGDAARDHVHRLRDHVDAVMVGSGTALRDDPVLTVRRNGSFVRCPIRVLVDSGLRVPVKRSLFQDEHSDRTWVLTGRRAPANRRAAREAAGARLYTVPGQRGVLDLEAALVKLADGGLGSLLVEGGGGLAAALLRRGLVDEVHWFASPSLLGGDAREAIGSLGIGKLGGRPRLIVRSIRRLGQDVYVHGVLPPNPGSPT
ncbi:MAG: bifunctional diaminohydroxyphosphoribosylaminopyrimidine deaminase/5-amino-6-(5-phosphoribosylamino)uracil reductase RibD [bacterium]|nr:bifunctional diaminohydroxyphosphoribosylaminopyrimidine deaminase/5-amino-6-(5-phosphoribosylamino)uracil reductase RibD [bacterium]MCP5071216.1 bifunctional diaminohydroxyphosphoribosylaminopyrimidine deaminase/5-amino-6-(5-phosphoribosylamino)uracil reductase RibD [bacterium]